LAVALLQSVFRQSGLAMEVFEEQQFIWRTGPRLGG